MQLYTEYLLLSAMVFMISLFGIIINRRNIIALLMCIELMLLAVNTNFLVFSNYLNLISGQVFVLFVLAVAAAESAIGLAIFVLLYRQTNSVDVDSISTLKG